MEEALIAKLLATSGVASLAQARVFPGRRPQGSALPAIVLNRISGAPIYTDQGESGLVTARIQSIAGERHSLRRSGPRGP